MPEQEGSVISLLNDPHIRDAMLSVVDLTDKRLGAISMENFADAPILQSANTASPEMVFMRMNRKPTIAHQIGSLSEIPAHAASRTLQTAREEPCVVGARHVFSRQELITAKRLEDLIAAGRGDNPEGMELLSYFTSMPGMMAEAIYALDRAIMSKICRTGKADYVDPFTGVQCDIDYTDWINPELFPDALTGDARWNQHETATGIDDIVRLMRVIIDGETGAIPSYMVISRTLLHHLMSQDSTKLKLSSLNSVIPAGDANIGAVVRGSMEELGAAIARDATIGSFRVFPWDEVYYQVQEDQSISSGIPMIPPDAFFLGVENNGRTVHLPTPENNWQPGIAMQLKRKDEFPVSESLSVLAHTFPAVYDPRVLASQQTLG